MAVSIPKARHTIERQADLIQVTLPSKKSLLVILWGCFALLWWGGFVYAFFYLCSLLAQAVTFWNKQPSANQMNSMVMIAAIFGLIWLLFILSIGVAEIYSLCRIMTGKEIIEVNHQILKITRQVLGWKRVHEYPAGQVKDMRVTQTPSGFPPLESYRKLLGLDGKISFNYGAKTFRFGLDIEEAEAKQIIAAIQEGVSG